MKRKELKDEVKERRKRYIYVCCTSHLSDIVEEKKEEKNRSSLFLIVIQIYVLINIYV